MNQSTWKKVWAWLYLPSPMYWNVQNTAWQYLLIRHIGFSPLEGHFVWCMHCDGRVDEGSCVRRCVWCGRPYGRGWKGQWTAGWKDCVRQGSTWLLQTLACSTNSCHTTAATQTSCSTTSLTPTAIVAQQYHTNSKYCVNIHTIYLKTTFPCRYSLVSIVCVDKEVGHGNEIGSEYEGK